jgi:hypothetical protein
MIVLKIVALIVFTYICFALPAVPNRSIGELW